MIRRLRERFALLLAPWLEPQDEETVLVFTADPTVYSNASNVTIDWKQTT